MRLRAWRMIRLLMLSAILVAVASVAWAPDPEYRWRSWFALGRYDAYNTLFTTEGHTQQIDPCLLKAMAWHGTKFDPGYHDVFEKHGLIPLTPQLAQSWAAAHRIETFMPTDLHDPQTNVRAAAWLLAQTRKSWLKRDRPEVFALAELVGGYEMIEARVTSPEMTAGELLPLLPVRVRDHVQAVIQRCEFYHSHGW